MKKRWLMVLVLYGLLIASGIVLGHWFSDWAMIDVRPVNEPEVHRMIMLVAAIYVLASALPFVPGAEIGLGLIAIFGARILVLVYLCMVVALLLSYCIGRFVPVSLTARLFAISGFMRAANFVLRTANLTSSERTIMLAEGSPKRWLPFLLRHRYVALALAFNIPGNTLLGGGGGLSLMAGLSGLFAPLPFFITILIVVAPIPMIILLTGSQVF